MSLTILYSDSIEKLAGELAGKIQSQRNTLKDPFRDIRVVVPNQNLAKWLKLNLAQTIGLCAGIQFPFLEGALWELTASLKPEAVAGRTMLSADMLQQAIAAMLISRNDAALAPLREYCKFIENSEETVKSLANPDCARRLWQLSGRLAACFREYEFQRGDMIEYWLSDASNSWYETKEGVKLSDTQKKMEAAQRALYRTLFAEKGLLASSEGSAFSLRQLKNAVFTSSGNCDKKENNKEQVYFFGLSSLSPLYAEMLHYLSGRYDLIVYHFNVCMEYWEDAPTRWERIKKAKQTVDDQGDEKLDLKIVAPT